MKNTSLKIKLTLGSGEVKTGLARVLADFKAVSSGITQSLQSIKGFADLKKRTAEIAKDYGEAQRKVVELARKMADGAGGAALAKDFDKAKLAAAKLKTELAAQQQQLHSVRGSMAAAGVSTSNLAGQQSALRSQLEATRKKYQDLANVAQARTTLGVTSHNDIAKEIDRAKAAYATLRTSGLATTNELAQAKVRLRERIDELREGTNGWKAALGNVKMGMLEIAAVAAPTVLAIGQAIKFESSMANVKKVVEGTPQELAALRGELLELTRVIPMTANELAAIAAAGGQLGIAVQDMTAFVTVTAKMATAFNMTAEEAGEAIGKIKTLYGLSIQEIEALGDTINRLGNTTAAKEKDIVDVMLRIGGSVKQVGMGNDQAAALASTMLSLGMQTEVAGTAINAMINRLLTGTMQGDKFQDAMAQIGLSAEEMAAQIAANPQQAIDTLLTSLGQLSGQKQAEVLTGLFGREHQDEIARLVTGADAYRKSLADLGNQANVTGAMNKEFEERVKTTEAQLQLLKNSVSEAGINLGTVFLPAIRDIIAPLTKGIQLLADFAEQFPNLSAAMVTIGTGAVAFGTIVKMAGIARLAVISMKTDVVAAIATIQGSTLGAWAASTVTAIKSVDLKAMTLKTTMGAIAGVLLAWEAGKWLGGLIGQIDWVQAAMVTMIHTAEQVGLAAQKMWAQLTGTDADVKAIDEKIAQDKQVYKEMLEEIKAGRGAGETSKPEPGKQPEAPENPKQSDTPDTQKKADPGYRTPEYLDRLDERVLTPEELADRKKRASGTESSPESSPEAAVGYRTPEYLDRLDERTLTPEELADRKKRWAEREQQEKELNGKKNDKLDEVAAANSKEDAKREHARLDEAERLKRRRNDETLPASIADTVTGNDDKAVAEKRKSPAKETSVTVRGGGIDKRSFGSEEELKAEKILRAEEKKAIAENLSRRWAAVSRAHWRIDGDLYAKAGDHILKGQTDREKARKEWQKAKPILEEQERLFSEFKNREEERDKKFVEEARQRNEELAESAKKSAEERAQAEENATGKAKSIIEQYATRVKKIQDEIAGRERSLADELSELDPHATEEQRWRRKAKAAADYEKAAKAAMAAGRLDDAREYADQAKTTYAGLKDGGGRISDKLADRTAFSGVSSAGNLGLSISKMMTEAAAKAAKSGLMGIDGLNSRVSAQLQKAMGALADAPTGPGKQPTQVHEIRLGKARLQGSADDVSDFIRQLELAGMTA